MIIEIGSLKINIVGFLHIFTQYNLLELLRYKSKVNVTYLK